MYRNHLAKLARTQLDDILLDEGILDREKVEVALAEREQTGKTLAQVLGELGFVDEWDMAKVVTTYYSLPFIDLLEMNLDRHVMKLLPLDFLRQHAIVPLDSFGDSFTLAVAEMPSPELLKEIVDFCGLTPFLYVGVRRQILEVIERFESKADDSMSVSMEVTSMAAVKEIAETTAPGMIPVIGLEVVSMTLDASVQVGGEDSGSTSQPAAASAPKPAAAAPAGGGGDSWESIFDSGDDAVKRR